MGTLDYSNPTEPVYVLQWKTHNMPASAFWKFKTQSEAEKAAGAIRGETKIHKYFIGIDSRTPNNP